jgi:hypothetical protein
VHALNNTVFARGQQGLNTISGFVAPRFRPPGFGPVRALGYSRRLMLLHFAYLDAGIGPAAASLADRLLGGDVDVCDDAATELLWARNTLARIGIAPSFTDIARAGTSLGLTSQWTPPGASPDPGAAVFRRNIAAAAHQLVCGEAHDRRCARERRCGPSCSATGTTSMHR